MANYEKSDTFVLEKCEITVEKKWYSEPHVDLHNLPKLQFFTSPLSSFLLPHSPLHTHKLFQTCNYFFLLLNIKVSVLCLLVSIYGLFPVLV